MMTISLLLKATVILGAALGATWLARRNRAAVRHLLLASSFAMLLVLPAASLVSPTVDVAMPATIESAIDPLDWQPVPLPDATPIPATVAILPHQRPAWQWPSRTELIVGVWVAGLTLFLLPIVVGLRQIRSLRRSSAAWPQGQTLVDALAVRASFQRRVELLLSEGVPGPMTCGVLRPAIILPADASTWARAELSRAIVHELEHVRRFDWLTQCLTRVVAAAYWFHPFVWIAWRRFALEAERACDDAVLCAEAQSDETAYADQLVTLAQRLRASSAQIHLAMASRRDLSSRITAVLDRGQRRGRAGHATVLAAITIAATLLVAISPLQIAVSGQERQTPATTGRLRYDVASIRECEAEENPTGARGTAGGTNAAFSPGRFYVPCVTTEQLIYLAYAGYGAREDERLVNDNPGAGSNATKVRGGPDWVHSSRVKYRIEATAEGATERTVLMGAMLRTLLEERFQLKLHRETEEVPMFKLVVAKGGFKLKPMKEDDCEQGDGPVNTQAPKPRCGNINMQSVNGRTRWVFGAHQISQLASMLTRDAGAHVINETGLTDKYVFTFEFVRSDATRGGTDAAPTGPDVNTALQEQLGLKLEPTRAPRGYLVIDSIQRPKPDVTVTTDTSTEQMPLAEGDSDSSPAQLSRGQGAGAGTNRSAPAPSESFDVVSIRPCASVATAQTGRGAGPNLAQTSPGRVYWACVTLASLADQAYAGWDFPLKNRQDDPLAFEGRRGEDGNAQQRLRGGPSWVYTERFTIEATAPVTVISPERGNLMRLPPPMNRALRAMLADRFQLRTRRETEEKPMYALTALPGGLKLKSRGPDDCKVWNETMPGRPTRDGLHEGEYVCGVILQPPPLARQARLDAGEDFEAVRTGPGPDRRVELYGVTLQKFADYLSGLLDRFVLDKTGVTGDFMFAFEYTRNENVKAGGVTILGPNSERKAASRFGRETAGRDQTIFKALEALGLKLAPTMGPAEYLVIESAQRPRPN